MPSAVSSASDTLHTSAATIHTECMQLIYCQIAANIGKNTIQLHRHTFHRPTVYAFFQCSMFFARRSSRRYTCRDRNTRNCSDPISFSLQTDQPLQLQNAKPLTHKPLKPYRMAGSSSCARMSVLRISFLMLAIPDHTLSTSGSETLPRSHDFVSCDAACAASDAIGTVSSSSSSAIVAMELLQQIRHGMHLKQPQHSLCNTA